MKCEKCLYRANCQFLAKHKGAEVEGCTAFKDATDFVEVVRCEKRDLWNEWDAHGRRELGNYVCSCAQWSTENGSICYTKPNDFCSYAEPKDGAE